MSSADSKIALVIVWFGPLPFWISAFLLSCRYNPKVEWLIFSDAPRPSGLPDNVKFLPMDLKMFNCRASEALGFNVQVTSAFAYKMCDLKIMYGRIFAPELQEFGFWGCCDMDIAWGDIRRFITDDILANYDVITSRIGRISGHFCLFRNHSEWTNLFRRIPDIAARVADSGTYRRIDEDGLSELLQGYGRSWLRRFWATRIRKLPLPRVYWERVLTTSGKHLRLMLADPTLSLRWRQGRTYGVHGEEMMYLHFHTIHKGMKGIDFDLGDPPREIAISPAGLFAVRTEENAGPENRVVGAVVGTQENR